MGFILQSDYVFNDFTSQGLDKVPVNARVRVGLYTYVLVKEGASASTTIQQGIDGGFLLAEQRGGKEVNTTAGNMYLLVPSSITNPEGDLRVKCYDNGGNLTCSFTLAMLGVGLEEFKITKCIYSKDLKGTRVSNSYGGLFYGGFGLLQNAGGIYFSVLDNSKCEKIIVEYSDCNFVPSLVGITNTTPSITEKIYAIREGGGTWIQDLGCIKNNYRNNGTSASGESLEFYLFSNGFVRWTSAMTLDANYFHQWSNGNFGSLNIDASDKYLCNVGSKVGQTLGTIKQAELPNTKGKLYKSGQRDAQFTMAMYGVTYSSFQSFKDKIGSDLGVFDVDWYPNVTAGGTVNVGGGLYSPYSIGFNASRSNSTYKDGAGVFGDCIPNFLVIQAF